MNGFSSARWKVKIIFALQLAAVAITVANSDTFRRSGRSGGHSAASEPVDYRAPSRRRRDAGLQAALRLPVLRVLPPAHHGRFSVWLNVQRQIPD